METKTLQLTISGKVQGVFYRATAKETADKLGIKGWVRNTPEGNVSILCQGAGKQMEDFLSWCRQGPAKAKVESVDVKEITSPPLSDFVIIRGA